LIEHKHLTDLTVVVVSLDRQKYLQRQIDYWSGSGVTLLLVDGSHCSTSFEIESEFRNEVLYIHRPESIWNRLQLASELVKTRYCVLLPDDEFFIKSAVNEFIELMETEPEIDSVVGSAIRFSFRDPILHASEVYSAFRNITGSKKYGLPGIEQFWNDENYVVHFPIYSVMRSRAFKKMTTVAFSRNFGNAYAHEVLFNVVFPFYFYSVVVPTLCWLRSDENLPLSSESFNRSVRFSSWFTDPLNQTAQIDFLKHGASAIDDGSSTYFERVDFIQNLLSGFSSKDFERQQNESVRIIDLASRYLKQRAVFRVLLSLTHSLPRVFLRVIGYELEDLASIGKRLKIKGVKVDQHELEEVSKLIKLFHSKANLDNC
jgi:glycosyltransferase domain-containing protein